MIHMRSVERHGTSYSTGIRLLVTMTICLSLTYSESQRPVTSMLSRLLIPSGPGSRPPGLAVTGSYWSQLKMPSDQETHNTHE